MKKILLAISAVALMFAGCTKDLTNDVAHSGVIERGPLVEKTAIFADSRVERNDEGKLSWNEGDKVAVVLLNSDGSYALDTEAYEVNYTNGKIYVPENAAYVIYPYEQRGTLSGTTLTLNLPQTYTVADPVQIFDYALMKGVVTGDIIEFNNLMGYIKVPLQGDGTLKSVTFKTNNHPTMTQGLSAKATLDLSKNVAEDGGLAMTTTNETRSYVKVVFSNFVDMGAAANVWIPVPENVYTNSALVIETADAGAYSIYATASHSVTRSTVKPISATPINLADHKPAEPTSVSGTSGTSYNDYASCYIVPPTAGAYSYKCVLADGTELTKGGVTAEIVWTEEVGLVYDLHYDPTANVISFKTNGHEGNALVALTKNDFGTKTIVWSWLLWCTDQPRDILVPGAGGSAAHRYMLMDRVVGATWAPTAELEDQRTALGTSEKYEMNASISAEDATNACGLYYQFQNMMPYPRMKDINFAANGHGNENTTTLQNTKIAAMYGFHQWAQIWTGGSASASTITVDENGQYRTASSYNPQYQYWVDGGKTWNHSYLSTSEGGASSVKDLVIDVDGVKGYRLWRSCTNQQSQMQLKTNHDPCPPGYMLDNSSATYHYANNRAAAFGYVRNPQDDASYKQGYRLYGMYLNGCWNGTENDANKTVLYFPCGANRGQMRAGGADSYGNMGFIYVILTGANVSFEFTHNSKTYKTAKGACIQYGATGNGGTTLGNLGWSTGKTVNGQAYHVRCRKGGK